jgi:hypothetical protein
MAGGISYHAKDVLFKSLSELYQNQALDVYGLHGLPKIKTLLPNEYPAVRADEKRSDTLFLLEDDSILLLEYESNQRFIENHLKYLDYAYRILTHTIDSRNKSGLFISLSFIRAKSQALANNCTLEMC